MLSAQVRLPATVPAPKVARDNVRAARAALRGVRASIDAAKASVSDCKGAWKEQGERREVIEARVLEDQGGASDLLAYRQSVEAERDARRGLSRALDVLKNYKRAEVKCLAELDRVTEDLLLAMEDGPR